MDLIRTLNSVGKSTFIKYYYNFKNNSREACIMQFEEPFTDKAKLTRTGHAQRIFREGMNIEALKIIVDSVRVDDEMNKLSQEMRNLRRFLALVFCRDNQMTRWISVKFKLKDMLLGKTITSLSSRRIFSLLYPFEQNKFVKQHSI